jgi:VanZ family protein
MPHDSTELGLMTRRLPAGALLLGYMVLVTAVITLAPFRFARPAVPTLSWLADPADVVANVLLFFPLGFLFRVSAPRAVGHVRTIVAACLVSVTFEAAQLFLPGRFSSPVDVMSNTLGAGLGSLVHARIAAHLDGRLVRGLALELPLMVVVYLLVPLLWLDGFAAGHDGGRLVLSPLLGLAGAIVLAAIWRHRLAGRGVLSPARLAWVTAGWYVVGAAPGLIRRPLLVLGAALLVALVARLEAARPLPLVAERRFELPTLRRVWPLLVTYLILSALWPITWPPWPGPSMQWTPGPWHGGWGIADLADMPGVTPMLRALEYLAAFTLLGYTVAESRGRLEEGTGPRLARLAGASVLCAAALEALRGFHPGHGASVLLLLLTTAMSLYGGLVYRIQLAVVREAVAPRAP